VALYHQHTIFLDVGIRSGNSLDETIMVAAIIVCFHVHVFMGLCNLIPEVPGQAKLPLRSYYLGEDAQLVISPEGLTEITSLHLLAELVRDRTRIYTLFYFVCSTMQNLSWYLASGGDIPGIFLVCSRYQHSHTASRS
jgi:hypothetical protein